MGLREALQTELWGEKASQRILFAVFVSAALAIFGWKAWRVYEYYWLTDGERRAARIALQEIDEVRRTNAANYEEFDAMLRPEKNAIAAAEAAAVTERDQITVMQLQACDIQVTSDRLSAMVQRIPATTSRQKESKAEFQLGISKSRDLTAGKCEALKRALY